MAALVDHYNLKSGQCNPSFARLSRKIGRNRSTVIRSTNSLKRKGIISSQPPSAASRTPNYHINWEKIRDWYSVYSEKRAYEQRGGTDATPAIQTTVNQCHRGGTLSRGGVSSNTEWGGAGATQTLPRTPSIKPDKKHTSLQEASARVYEDLRQALSKDEMAAVIEADTGALQRATEAEQRRRGAGIEALAAESRQVARFPGSGLASA